MSSKIKKSKSLGYYAWSKFKKDKVALAGLIFILISVLVAVLGAIVRPDATPMANEMSLQLSAKEPGFTVKVLKVRKNKPEDKKLFYQLMFFGGKENDYTIIPINNYWFENNNLVVEQYTDDAKLKGIITKYNIADVVYPIDYNNYFDTDASDGYLEFYVINGDKQKVSVEDLKKEIISNHIITQTYWLGTDRFGRDMLSRLMSGTIVSLSVGFISVFISIVIGLTLGAIAGYYRGKIDDIIVWLINVVWSIPTLLLVIAITLALGKGFWQVFIAVGLTMWVEVARVVRGQVLSLREKEFVEAGRALGFTNFRIILYHVLPNVISPVIVISAGNFASAILVEAGLSFLGIGAQPPMASWGTMIRDHYGYIITGKAYLAVLPGLAIMFMVLAFMLVGNGLRDALDTKDVEETTDKVMTL
jgi:peptide/nickel transport system permease protein